MGKILASVALGFILSSTAAVAAPAGKQGAKPSSDNQGPTYCVRTEATGSRYSKMECHTKAEWRRLGVDVDELLKK